MGHWTSFNNYASVIIQNFTCLWDWERNHCIVWYDVGQNDVLYNVLAWHSHYCFATKTFCTTTYILFSLEVESTQLAFRTGHCALCSRDLNEWQVASVHSAPVVLLSPAKLNTNLVSSWHSHWGKRVSYETALLRNDGSTIISLYNIFVYVVYLYTTFTWQFFVV